MVYACPVGPAPSLCLRQSRTESSGGPLVQYPWNLDNQSRKNANTPQKFQKRTKDPPNSKMNKCMLPLASIPSEGRTYSLYPFFGFIFGGSFFTYYTLAYSEGTMAHTLEMEGVVVPETVDELEVVEGTFPLGKFID
mmetsp:Transcript_1614/g.3435  ORF Transcript_1614/g.3435 Transcript_1614/m.3435 type:complete len:137 (-) Transcript_1614:41-451(-)